MTASKDQIKQANRPVAIPIASLNDDIFIKRLTVRQKRDWVDTVRKEGTDQRELGMQLISMSLVNEDGTPMFTTEELLDLDDLVLSEIVVGIRTLNQLIGKSPVKEAEKNLEPNPDASTSS